MKKTIFTVLMSGLVALALTTPVLAATTVSLSPTSINATAGRSFNLTVKIDPQSVKNYTAKIVLTYPADLLRVNSFTFGTSWMPVNQPGYDLIDNVNGTLIKTAGYPGGVSSQATFGTVSFTARKAGSGVIKIGNNSLVLNATNQNLLSSSNVQASFSIAAVPVVTTPTEGTTTEEEIATSTEQVQIPEQQVVKEEIPQISLLANLSIAWGGANQLTLVIVIAVLCLIVLAFIGFKEWRPTYKRKKR